MVARLRSRIEFIRKRIAARIRRFGPNHPVTQWAGPLGILALALVLAILGHRYSGERALTQWLEHHSPSLLLWEKSLALRGYSRRLKPDEYRAAYRSLQSESPLDGEVWSDPTSGWLALPQATETIFYSRKRDPFPPSGSWHRLSIGYLALEKWLSETEGLGGDSAAGANPSIRKNSRPAKLSDRRQIHY